MEDMIPQINVEPIISRAFQGDSEALSRLPELEVDYQGRWVGFAGSQALWLRVAQQTGAR